MPDLEQKISEWRKQMLAAGIKSPVPLEELEIHLREEIERQMQLESDEQKAFNSAVQKIGHGSVLNDEFKKIDGQKIGQTILLIIGWFTAGFLLLWGMVSLDLHWNFIIWKPKYDSAAMFGYFTMLATVIGIWFLVKADNHKTTRLLSLLICLYLSWRAIFVCLPAEKQYAHAHGDGSPMSEFFAANLNDRTPSPFWYRGINALLLLSPTLFWIRQEWRRGIQKRTSRNKKRLVHSS
jgi:hypothetical protein